MAQSRLDLYLQWGVGEHYVNTDEEQELVTKFVALYSLSKSAQMETSECNPENLDKYRKAYYGVLNALNQDGTESKRKSRQLRKMVYEFIESKIDNSIPLPKMMPRYKKDLPVVNITEEYLKYEANQILTKYVNDASERSTYVDGTSWYKISWDSLDSTHERSGQPKIELRMCEQVIPQPGVKDYKKLEYIFEETQVSITRIYDLYNRMVTPERGNSNVVDVVYCYYLNDDRIVGLFGWCKSSQQVICNERDWQIRKIRKCTNCGTINPEGEECRFCGNTSFLYENATVEILEEPLMEIYNPYEVGETSDENEKDHYAGREFLPAGAEVPFYRIDQLPFVPRVSISSMDSIYGISEVKIVLDEQDAYNKVMTKAVDKTLKSGAVVTKPSKLKIGDTDDTFKILDVRTAEEASMVTTKQIVADTSQDLLIASLLYDSGKQSSGITDSFQGQRDTTATSGKAKQFAAMQTAGRIESLRVMKSAAFSGVYELLLKYLLAFSDEPRSFCKTLPDGSKVEETWSKYLFLDKDKYGKVYYRDDFIFDSDPAATLSQNRLQMWQECKNSFIQGEFGNPADPRTLKLYWNIMDALQYPLAKVALAGISDNEQHLPFDVEQALMQNPDVLQMALGSMTENRGGARQNSGPSGNGATHAANVERTNNRNRAENRDVPTNGQQGSAGGAL